MDKTWENNLKEKKKKNDYSDTGLQCYTFTKTDI